jgi:two-component system, NtrC family, sensor kinase
MKNSDAFEDAYYREKKARKQAENILEEKTRELYISNQELKVANEELTRQQAQMVKTEKLAALGTLSAGVAHEINNPLSFVISNINALKRYCQRFINVVDAVKRNQDEFPESVNQAMADLEKKRDADYIINDTQVIFSEVNSGLKRVSDIVLNLKSFARTNPSDRNHADINEGIRSALKILNNEIKYKCELEVNLQTLPEIYCNLNEVSQVFLNIIHNAVQAIKKQGTIRINSWYDQAINITIADDGEGMDKEILAQIFNPFYTNKPLGMGTGLGLSVSHGIIEDLGGRISVKSEINKGTEFTIILPVEQRKRDRAK